MNKHLEHPLVLAFLFLVLMGGCGKCQKDDELTLVKTPYHGDDIRLDGYYYLMSSTSNSFNDTYFFYRDGTVLSCRGTPVGESPFLFMERLLKDPNISNDLQKYKSGWGVFRIEDNNIAIDRWYAQEGILPAGLLEGIVLNDTTFQITSLTRVKTGEVREKNDLYHFRAFSPKPDSTNVFIP